MKILALIFTLILASCSTHLTRDEWSNINFGKKPNNPNYLIEQSLKRVLIDPDSLKLSCDEPKQGWASKDNFFNQIKYGWLVFCTVNAKNRFGGYTGNTPYIYLFRGDIITFKYSDDRFFEGTNYELKPVDL